MEAEAASVPTSDNNSEKIAEAMEIQTGEDDSTRDSLTDQAQSEPDVPTDATTDIECDDKPDDTEPPKKDAGSDDKPVETEAKKPDEVETKEPDTEAKKSDAESSDKPETNDKAADKEATEDDLEPPAKKAKTDGGRSLELAKFWKVVEEDPSDFTGWTYLLQYVDSTTEVEAGREAYDAFLHRYPYCYGYWKKFADFEKKKGTTEKCMMVFERGIKAIPLSADLWIHYLNHVKVEYAGQLEFIRAQYERAMEACGKEWRSDKLWDHYVKWETENKAYTNVLKLYDRIIRNPTQGLSHQFDMFRDFVKEHNPKDVLDVNDFLALRKEILQSKRDKEEKDKKNDDKDENAEEAKVKTEDGTPAEEENAPGENLDEVCSDEENIAMREKIIFERRKVFKETEEKAQGRWKYEENIKRPYFHMKPLERGQLKNWNDYLDNQMKEASNGKASEESVEILFERCLIACALYEDFWMKYIDWLQKKTDNTEKIKEVFRRACEHHLPKKIDIHIQWAAYEENCNDFDKANVILENLEKQHPQLMSLRLRRINLERRRKNMDKVIELYRGCIEKSPNPTIKSEMAVKFARFLRFQTDKREEAIKILKETVETDEKNPKLYLQLLDIYLHADPIVESDVLGLFDSAIEKVHPKQKILFSRRKIEFLEDFGSNIKVLTEAQANHMKLSRQYQVRSSSPPPEQGSGIKTIEGRTGKKSVNGSGTTYSSSNNSYNAQHNSQYQQYGARYNSQYPSYNQSYNNYYQQGYGGYGGGYGSGY